jgi:DNA-binding NarL/FixJ family response regulator
MAERLQTRSLRNYQHEGRRPHLRLLRGAAERAPFAHGALDRVGLPRPVRGESPTGSTRVLIADAHALVRAGYRALLETAAGIEVVAEAASRLDAVALATETGPDVVLLDPGLPGLGDLEATSSLLAHPAFVGVAIVLTVSGDGDDGVLRALRAGAVGVLRKDEEPAALIDSVRLLAQGQALLPATAVRALVGEIPQGLPHFAHLTGHMEELTDREREIVALAAQGLTNGEIAARLVISPATAKTHVSRAMIKLHARHRAELVVSAYESGLVRPRQMSSTAGPALV